MLGPLGKFMHAIDGEAETNPSNRVTAFERYCALELRERQARLRQAGGTSAPLFTMLTKADQIFGADADASPKGHIDGNDPWGTLLKANKSKGSRAPYWAMADNFQSINLDFSAACIGGAELVSVEEFDETGNKITKQRKLIPNEQLGNGRGIWEPLLWLLRRIEDIEARKEWLAVEAQRKPVSRWCRRLLTPQGVQEWVQHHDRLKKSPFDERRNTDREFRQLTDRS
jgi:hypothetical protein